MNHLSSLDNPEENFFVKEGSTCESILDSATDFAIIVMDLAGLIRFWNLGAEKILGWSRSEIVDRPMDRFFTEEDRSDGRPAYERTKALTNGSAEDERWHLRKDGLKFWASGKLSPLRDEDGAVVGFIKILRDRTDRKNEAQRQEVLLRVSDQMRITSEPGQVILLALQAIGKFLAVDRVGFGEIQDDDENVALETGFLDHGLEPIVGVFSLASFGEYQIRQQRKGFTVHSADVSKDLDYHPEAWEPINTRAFISVPLIRDGRFRAVLYVNRREPYEWPPEEVEFVEEVAARIWDAIERSRAEVALREANETLEARIKEAVEAQRSVEETLRQSQKMEAVGQLTGGIAHDFNNLLQTIGGSLELARRRLDHGRIREASSLIEVASSGVDKAAILTNRLLAFSRHQTLEIKPVLIDDLVRGMVDMIRRTVNPSVTIKTNFGCSDWQSLTDANQLENALLNLVINSRDAMPAGGTLTISTRAISLTKRDLVWSEGITPGEFIEISVSDTGTGIPEDIKARVFDPFFTTKPSGQGTGLGLSQVYGFVHQMGGSVVIDSEVGHGTTVRIRFRRCETEQIKPDGNKRQEAILIDHAKSRLSTILLVEDEEDIRGFTSDILRETGYTVVEAADGESAIDSLDQVGRIDLVVTDVGLPGINGRQVAEKVRARHPGVPVLFATGYAGDVLNYELSDGMAMITKPYSLKSLLHKVQALLSEEAQRNRTNILYLP